MQQLKRNQANESYNESVREGDRMSIAIYTLCVRESIWVYPLQVITGRDLSIEESNRKV